MPSFSKTPQFYRHLLLSSFLLLLLALVYNYVSQYSFIRLNVETNIATPLTFSWSDSRGNFSELLRTKKLSISQYKDFYVLPAKGLDQAGTIRVGTGRSKSVITFKEIAIYKLGRETLRLRSPKGFAALTPDHNIEITRTTKKAITFTATGTEPSFTLTPPPMAARPVLGYNLVRALLVFGLIFFVLQNARRLTRNYQYVIFALLIVATLVTVMATISRPNAHPDEYTHFAAGKYYMDHWLPAKACERKTLTSYSAYGVSRLNSFEISYFLAGKFARLVDFVPVTYYLKLRAFNCLLLFLIIALALKRKSARILAIPLLISPQAWYLFSYFNSDAFALFVCFLAAYQLVEPTSWLRQMFTVSARNNLNPVLFIVLGMLLAALLLAKMNYYFFMVFAGLLVCWQMWRLGFVGQLQQHLTAAIKLTIVAIILTGSWIGSHHYSNEFNRTDAIQACQDQTAYKMKGSFSQTNYNKPTTYWRDKGYPFKKLFTRGWHQTMFRSSFGVYGYFQLPNDKYQFRLTAMILAGFGVFLLASILLRGTADQRVTVVSTLLVFSFLVAVLLWKAWTRDFQPQGRYLAPMLPMFGILLYQCRQGINQNILALFTIALYSLSCFSFLSVAILNISKTT